jgi:hypothetical protein
LFSPPTCIPNSSTAGISNGKITLLSTVLPQYLLLGLLVGVQRLQLSFTPVAAAAAAIASQTMTIGCIHC